MHQWNVVKTRGKEDARIRISKFTSCLEESDCQFAGDVGAR